MASYYPSITDEQAALIRNATMFFVASADPELASGPDGTGPVNVSPKGGVALHILDRNRVAYLDYRGSGNETARHCSAGGPITVMVCSFEEGDAAIVRLFGTARVSPLTDSPLAQLLRAHPAEELKGPARQVIEIQVEKTMTSCGYGVPVMQLVRQRRVVDRGRRYKQANAPRVAVST
jgi:pyridoxamine 5'-phosphate oxidase-like protein